MIEKEGRGSGGGEAGVIEKRRMEGVGEGKEVGREGVGERAGRPMGE